MGGGIDIGGRERGEGGMGGKGGRGWVCVRAGREGIGVRVGTEGMSSYRERGDWSSCVDGGYEFVSGRRYSSSGGNFYFIFF